MLKKDTILGVGITNETAEEVLEYILKRLHQKTKFYIVTPNPEILVYANKHPEYKKILNEADIALADGAGLFLASIFMAKPFKQRIPGVDFMEELCKRANELPISIGLLGGRDGVAEKTAECLLKKYPKLRIVYVGEEWSEAGFANAARFTQISKRIEADGEDPRKSTSNQRKSIDILFVAFGHPKQEEFISQNLNKIPVTAAMGVGGAFDYISGNVHRAPLIVRALGFEWLHRLVKQPWRWKRQLALLEFVKLVFKERFK